jgi:hypothetical protein
VAPEVTGNPFMWCAFELLCHEDDRVPVPEYGPLVVAQIAQIELRLPREDGASTSGGGTVLGSEDIAYTYTATVSETFE